MISPPLPLLLLLWLPPLLPQVRAERAAMLSKHSAALHDLQRLPSFLRLLSLHIMQVGTSTMQQGRHIATNYMSPAGSLPPEATGHASIDCPCSCLP